jgi:Rrf2 family protein
VKRRKRRSAFIAELSQSPIYSRNCQDAMRIMERLAASELGRRGSVRSLDSLAKETGMALPTLAQVVSFLGLAGLVAERRSPPGVRLARPVSDISLLDVVRATDGTGLMRRCLMGLPECSDAAPCSVHAVWKKAREEVERHLGSQSIADLTRALAIRRRAVRSTGARGFRLRRSRRDRQPRDSKGPRGT